MSMPSVFGLPHLSEDAVAAFADGVLAPSADARARRHCLECRECAEAVRGQREAAMLLRSAVAPSLPSGLLDRLAGLPMTADLPPSIGLPTAVGPDGRPMLVAYRPEPPRERSAMTGSDPSSVDEPSHEPERSWHAGRRAALPIGLIASAAAVVAAGTLGALGNAGEGPSAPRNAANLSGAVTGTVSGSVLGTGSGVQSQQVRAVPPLSGFGAPAPASLQGRTVPEHIGPAVLRHWGTLYVEP